MAFDFENVSKFVSRIGFPATVVLIMLFQLNPKIDQGIQIANEVNGQLKYMVYQCQSLPRPQVIVP
jgi:hypothetical protein